MLAKEFGVRRPSTIKALKGPLPAGTNDWSVWSDELQKYQKRPLTVTLLNSQAKVDAAQEFFADDSSEESEPSPPVLDPLGPRLKREAAQAAAKEAAKLQLTGVAAVVLEGLPLTEREKELGEKNDVYIHMGEVRILQFIRIIIRFNSI